jgi:hypothetical protein
MAKLPREAPLDNLPATSPTLSSRPDAVNATGEYNRRLDHLANPTQGAAMSDEQYWTFGRKEVICITSGMVLLAVLSAVIRAAPPWWFLPLRGGSGLDRWGLYAAQGGYGHFWLQSLIGWLVIGAVLGLIFSNVILRGRKWGD